MAHGKLEGAVLRSYFDHNATTPISEAALAALTACLRDAPGNASSIHRFGQEAKQRLEQARRQVAAAAQAKPDQVIFTGGGTEANNLAIFGSLRAGKRHVVTTAVEHPAVLSPARELDVTVVGVDGQGLVDPDEIRRAIRPETALISVMSVNNELGTIQPLALVHAVAREYGVPLHTDAVQALGKTAIYPAELVTLSAHKVYGPQGIGALIARVPVRKVTFGGHHERDRRPGTENVAGAVAFGAACMDLSAVGPELRDQLEREILRRIPRTRVNGAGAPRVANTANVLFEGIEGEPLVIGLDLRGFAVSSGSACSSGAVEPSHVLTAIGLSREDARSCLRFSLGRANTEAEVLALVDALEPVVARLRKLSPAYV
ncbi:MAG: cysteine desulfurase [Bryobacteraceae bacterium]|nr:cysteine desulfurase [Bryobacteraceae bacterium]